MRSRAKVTWLWYQTVTGASPLLCMVTRPLLSTVATPSSPLSYLAHRVTSALCPSEKYAVTSSCCWAPGRREASPGSTSILVTRASDSLGAGIAWESHPDITLYSGESTGNRLPPPWGVVIHLGIVAAQGKLEAVLPGCRAMAWTRVTAHLGHHRQHVVAKTPGGC